ncbi:MAG: hypothetical protein DHS80DRAFT_28982 [Piptocephalis tieghemiana]|nr:MAG: hypothetical protein DHS80DRAFT_28982 [Piptocephalis tieghemiana]
MHPKALMILCCAFIPLAQQTHASPVQGMTMEDLDNLSLGKPNDSDIILTQNYVTSINDFRKGVPIKADNQVILFAANRTRAHTEDPSLAPDHSSDPVLWRYLMVLGKQNCQPLQIYSSWSHKELTINQWISGTPMIRTGLDDASATHFGAAKTLIPPLARGQQGFPLFTILVTARCSPHP